MIEPLRRKFQQERQNAGVKVGFDQQHLALPDLRQASRGVQSRDGRAGAMPLAGRNPNTAESARCWLIERRTV